MVQSYYLLRKITLICLVFSDNNYPPLPHEPSALCELSEANPLVWLCDSKDTSKLLRLFGA